MTEIKKIPAWAVIIFFAGTFLLMNLLTPHLTDDYAYSFVWDGAHGGNFRNDVGDLQRVQSIGDVIVSQYSHWLTWGGRSVAHTLLQTFGMADKIFFDFANAFMYAALALIIYFLGTGKLSLNPKSCLLIPIFFALWFCLPEFYQTTLWETGSLNYLWMAVFQFAFLLPFVLKFWNKDFKFNSAFAIPLGLLAGWSNEAGASMILFITFWAIIYFWRQKKLERWMLAGFIAALIGFAFMMLAPGNFSRMESDTEDVTLLEMLADNFSEGFLPVLLGDLILFLPIILYFLRGKKSVPTTQFILAFTATGIFLPCLLMLSPYFPARAAFASPIFLTIAAVASMQNISIHLPKKFLYAVGIFWLATILYALSVDWSVYSQMKLRHNYIFAHRNEEFITVQPIILPPTTEKIFWTWTLNHFAIFYNDLTPYTHINRNKTYAKYFGVKNLVVDEEQWLKLNEEDKLPLYDN